MTLNEPVDLTNCDREPIHIPGSIQPHGCLLACDSTAGRVLRHSANSLAMLNFGAEINGADLSDVLGGEVAHAVRNALARTSEGARSALLFGKSLPNGRTFDIAVHRFKGSAIIELEPAEASVAEPLELARAMIGRITAIESIDRLVRDTARLIQAMLGYDRVMVYQFGHDGAGKVVSEAKRSDLESFLGQYFPASDIPVQARALYLKNTIRIISDANFERIPVFPVLDASGEPLDLSFAHLRSVSPIHCEYLRNMGVGASMSVSIIVDGALWGLIACHHYSPRTLSMAERVAAEMFGEFFSLHLDALRHKQSLDVATKARDALDRFLREVSRAEDISDALRSHLPDFARLIPSDGVGMWLDGQWSASGSTPPRAAVTGLTRFAETVAEGKVWASHQISTVLPDAEDYAADAAGMLIIPLSQRPRDYLFYFRKEVVQTLDWGGNPEKTYETGPLGDRLTPRKSFAIWKETVRLQAAPWTEGERQFGEAARAALVEIVLQHSELLADERAKAEVRQRMLNEELNHRVKNILAVIKSLVTHASSEGQSLEDYVESLRGRIQALAFAHDQVVRGDGGGDLRELLDAELTPYRQAAEIRLEGPAVWLDARAFSVMALVLHELATNAAKYGALSRQSGQLAIVWSIDVLGALDLSWKETGGPTVAPPSRKGFGTVLVDRSIPFDLGGESSVQYHPRGVEAAFRLPAKFVALRRGAQTTAATFARAPDIASAAPDLAGRSVLLLEDQMLIAMDLEQLMLDAGLVIMATTTSVSEAMAQLKLGRPDVAILDINLGNELSLPVAEHLRSLGVPFLFATGYGEGQSIPPHLADVPMVRKPYDSAALLTQLQKLLA